MPLGRPDQHDAARARRDARDRRVAIMSARQRIIDQQRIPVPLRQQRDGAVLVGHHAGLGAPARRAGAPAARLRFPPRPRSAPPCHARSGAANSGASSLGRRRQRHREAEGGAAARLRSRPRCGRPCARRCAWRSQGPGRCRRTCAWTIRRPARNRGRCAPDLPARCRCRCRAPGNGFRCARSPGSTMTATPPASVNLMALPARLSSTWRKRAASPTTCPGSRSSTNDAISIPFACARGASSSTVSSTSADKRERPRLQIELAGLDLGEIENFLDQRQQRFARGLRRLGVGELLGRQRRVEQQIGHAENAVERRADFMADHGEEARLGAVGGFGLVARASNARSASTRSVTSRPTLCTSLPARRAPRLRARRSSARCAAGDLLVVHAGAVGQHRHAPAREWAAAYRADQSRASFRRARRRRRWRK